MNNAAEDRRHVAPHYGSVRAAITRSLIIMVSLRVRFQCGRD